MRSLLASSLLVALLGFAPTAAGQDTEARREAVDDFHRFFRTYRESAERVEAVRTLEGMECPEAARTLLDLLEHRDPLVGAAAMAVLAGYSEPASFAAVLEELPTIRKADRQARWIEVLGAAGVVDAVPVLLELASAKRAATVVKYQAARALGRLGDDSAAAVLSDLLRDSDAQVRLAAADAVGKLKLRSLSGEVIALLEDGDWRVQSASARALGLLRPQVAVEPLIALMRDGGRLQEDAAEALFAITALDFGTDPDMWQRQWERLQSIDWRIPTEAELQKARQSRQRADAYYGKSEKTTFSGISTTSTRVLFIIDVSASMQDQITEREKFEAEYDDFTKLTIVKTELQRTIEGLGPNTLFNIVAFATDLDVWKKRPVAANVVNKSSATAWVRRLKAIGGGDAGDLAAAGLSLSANAGGGRTNTFKALMYPFGVDPDKPKAVPKPAKDGLDTVFFLSDGRPSTGAMVDTMEIVDEVNRVNEAHKIVIHAIAIGDFQKEFVRTLAEQNGGVFVDLGR